MPADQPFVPRTEREYWVAIADALNTAESVGMPVGIDLDGTLTDHRTWSVVWNREAERWEVAGYDDDIDATGALAADPLVVSRFDVAMEPAPEDEQLLTIGCIAADGRPVALLLDAETRAKVAGWLVPTVELNAMERQLLTFALELAADQMATRADEFDDGDRGALEYLRSLTGQQALLAPDFFQPGHTYTADDGWQFRCDSVTSHPDNGELTALGWRHWRGEWETYAYHADDWDLAKFDGRAATGAPRG